jgi:hypothetical protein
MEIKAEIIKNISGQLLTTYCSHNSSEKIKLKEVKEEIPCIHCNGIKYYDLIKIKYLTNNDIVQLIEIIKSDIKIGKEICFINTNETIKKKIKSIKLEHLFNFE